MLSFGWSLPRPPTSKSFSPFSNPLVTVPNAPITIGIIVTCMFHSFFQFSSKVEVLIFLFTFFQFYFVLSRDSKVDNFVSSLFFCWLTVSLVFGPRLGDPSVCQSPIGVYVSFSRTGAELCINHLLVCLNFLHISQWITLPTQSCLVLYSFCANLLHSLIMWLLLLIRVSHISVSWWSFTGDWVTASLLKSPGLISVFWPFTIMLLFGWFPLGLQLLNLPGPLIIL